MFFHQATDKLRLFCQVTLCLYFHFPARYLEMHLFKENIASIVDQNSGVFTLNCDILQCKTFHICHPYQFIGLSHQVFYQTILCRSFGDTIQINKQQ